MSDTSVGSERSIDVSISDDTVEVCDAGVQTSRSPRSRQSSSCSDNSEGVDLIPGGDYMGHPKVSWQDKLKSARKYKTDGNEKFKTGTYKAAIGKYHRALLFLKGIKEPNQGFRLFEECPMDTAANTLSDEAMAEATQLECDCFNNLSACILNTPSPAYSRVLQYSENVLKLVPSNTKALYRKGVALYNLKDPSGALTALDKARKQPGGDTDKNITKYMQYCERQVKEQDKKLKRTYRNMFENMSVGASGDDEDVFTDNVDDPNIVQPQRKLEKASSIA